MSCLYFVLPKCIVFIVPHCAVLFCDVLQCLYVLLCNKCCLLCFIVLYVSSGPPRKLHVASHGLSFNIFKFKYSVSTGWINKAKHCVSHNESELQINIEVNSNLLRGFPGRWLSPHLPQRYQLALLFL